MMEAFYFTFHDKHIYANYVQQVIAKDRSLAKKKMNQEYQDNWKKTFTEIEYKHHLFMGCFQDLKPLPPLYAHDRKRI